MLGDALLSPCIPLAVSLPTVTPCPCPQLYTHLHRMRGPELESGGVLGGCSATTVLGDAPGGHHGASAAPRATSGSLSPCWVPVTLLSPFAVGDRRGLRHPWRSRLGATTKPPVSPGISWGSPKGRGPFGSQPQALSSAAVGRPGPRCSGLSRFCQRAAESHLFGGARGDLWGFSSPSAFQKSLQQHPRRLFRSSTPEASLLLCFLTCC